MQNLDLKRLYPVAQVLRSFSAIFTCLMVFTPLWGEERLTALKQLSSNEPLVIESESSLAKFNIYFENDLFANTDRGYTNGVKISWTSAIVADYRTSNWFTTLASDIVEFFPFFESSGTQHNIALSLGQNMFTPSNTATSLSLPNDRPYAGWLYFGTSLHSMTKTRLDTVEINIGIIGALSGAEKSQNWVHDLRGIQRAKGWQNQLKNEPTLNLVWERKNAVFNAMIPDTPIGIDFITHYGLSLGNVYTYANAGADLRIGWNLPDDFGTSTIRLAGDNNAPMRNDDSAFPHQRSLGLYFFTGVDGRAIARNIFLDGNTFEDSQSVDKKTMVADIFGGVCLIYNNWKLAYTQVIRTQEYSTQTEHSEFGSINLSYAY